MRKVIRIDSGGFFVEDVILKQEDETPEDCIEVLCQDGFYRPKWDFDNEEWVEGKSQAELDQMELDRLLTPSLEEIAKAERELETIELLIELGVV